MSDNFEIVYINLEKRPEKKDKIENEFKKNNIINYKRFDAIDGNKFDEIPKLKISICQDTNISKGQYGCYLSHKKCYENFLESNKDFLLVLEDDVCFLDNFISGLHKISEISEKIDIDFIYLSRSHIIFENMFEIDKRYYYDDFIYSPIICGYGFHSYILTKKGVTKFLNIIEIYEKTLIKNGLGLPIDCLDYLKNIGKNNNIHMNIFALKKDTVKVIPDVSDTS
jgi:glycosyl transferase family 25